MSKRKQDINNAMQHFLNIGLRGIELEMAIDRLKVTWGWMDDQEAVKEERMYYIQFIDEFDAYFNKNINRGDDMISSKNEGGNYQTQFTKEEIMGINPDYWPFNIPVEKGNIKNKEDFA